MLFSPYCVRITWFTRDQHVKSAARLCLCRGKMRDMHVYRARSRKWLTLSAEFSFSRWWCMAGSRHTTTHMAMFRMAPPNSRPHLHLLVTSPLAICQGAFTREWRFHDHQMWVEEDQCGPSIPDDPRDCVRGLRRWFRVAGHSDGTAAVCRIPAVLISTYACGYLNVAYRSHVTAGRRR